VSQQAAPAEAVRAGEHDWAVQEAQADGTPVLLLQLVCGSSRRLQALHAALKSEKVVIASTDLTHLQPEMMVLHVQVLHKSNTPPT
jgi:hypothetical protein